MAKQFMDLLFSSYRRQVLGLLLLRPDDSLYVRQIARLTGVPAGSLHRELAALESAGLLLREPFGNQVRYRANRANPIYWELAEFHKQRKTGDRFIRRMVSEAKWFVIGSADDLG